MKTPDDTSNQTPNDTTSSVEKKAISGVSWRAKLNRKFVLGLTPERPPVGYDSKGNLMFSKSDVKNEAGFIVWDSTTDSPAGFGVKVRGKRATYILRKKINGKSVMPTIGPVMDFKETSIARDQARDYAKDIKRTGKNPNKTARDNAAAEVTLKQVMAAYRAHIVGRTQKPAKVETLRVLDRTVRKHDQWGWSDRRVRDITVAEIVKKFEEGRATPSANEQSFRWPAVATNWFIKNDEISAAQEGRSDRLKVNPFETLALNKHYRTRNQIEAELQEKGKRNPLRPSQELGAFLEAAWSKKNTNDNLTGVHYLMLMLLWGCRKSEHAQLVWGELLEETGEPGVGRRSTSHVCMKDDPEYGPHVFFYKTKNGLNHRLPIPPMTLNLLIARQSGAADEIVQRGFQSKSRPFVFPARSKFSRSGHYSNATALLGELKQEVGLANLSGHDFRRTFGAVMTNISVPDSIQRRFFNHSRSDVTDRYNVAEWSILREWMTKIEQGILTLAPNVFNALKPVEWPPLPAPAPHVCRDVKPRTGRPRKELPGEVTRSDE